MSPVRRSAAPFLVALLALVACGPAAEQAAVAPAASATAAPATKTAAPAPTPAAPSPAGGIELGPDDAGRAAIGAPDVATGRQGAVASADVAATKVGMDVLAQGGNAVDAAIAVGFALGVTHPTAGNIGGGGFMVIRLASGKTTSLDFRETAPAAATRDMFLDASGAPTRQSREGPLAAGIPGDVAGFALAHKKFGKLPWKDLLAPAIALARDGEVLDENGVADLIAGRAKADKILANLAAAPGSKPELVAAVTAFGALMTRPDGSPYAVGDRWKQPDLAVILEAIAAGGGKAFYRGPLADKLVAGVRALGGIWTARDLAGYKALERAPIRFPYHGAEVVTMPPPSAGGVTLRQILGGSELLGLDDLPWDSAERIHLYVEVLRRVYADRNLVMADPAFVRLPMKRLLDLGYLKGRTADIRRDRATPSSEIGAGVEVVEKPQTTHYSVVDGAGNAVATTFTLNGGFGAGVQIPGTGVTLNNEMDDFTAKPGAPNMYGLVQGPQNAIAPGKRMVSSMTPTIVTQGGKLRLVCGSPGGPTISTTVAQIVLQVIGHDVPLDRAIAAPRVHHQWLPDSIMHESGLPAATVAALGKLGHVLVDRGRIGHANCIEVVADGTLRAVADKGRDGGDAGAR